MLEVNLYNDKKRLLGSVVVGESEFPAGVSKITINGERGTNPRFQERVTNKPGFQLLLNLLRRSEATLTTVTINGIEKNSPDYLAFLVWIASKTHTLEINNCALGDSGFACLMSGILLPNGLSKLDLYLGVSAGAQKITRHQWTLLFEAVASSSLLETFWVYADFEHREEMGHVLADTLRRNRSVKLFSLFTPTFEKESTVLPNLLRAAVLQRKVEAFQLRLYGEFQVLSRNILADVVCRHDCSLRTLALNHVLPGPDDSIDGTIDERNSSVEDLEIIDAGLQCTGIMETVRLFDSLKQLNLSNNRISDLAPLNDFLLGRESTLEVLRLCGNHITEQDFKIFVQGLPRMSSLKVLLVKNNPFTESESCLTALKDALWLNTSLEYVSYPVSPLTTLDSTHLDSMIQLATSLNRGASRKLLDHYPLTLPRNLWAKVLKKAITIKYYGPTDDMNTPTNDANTPTLTSPRSDVVLWLLKNKMHF